MNTTSGVGLFIYLTDQSVLFKNRQNDLMRNVVKGTLRFVVASLALGFFSRIAIYFNLVSCIGKAVLSASYKKRNFKFLKIEYLKEAKYHMIGILIDLAVIILRLPVIALYAISPEQVIYVKKGLEKKLISQNIAN